MEEDDHTKLLLSLGGAVEDKEFVHELQYRLCTQLLNKTTRTLQFPGSQPVSFTRSHLSLLEQEDYYVCEKSDGVRYLLYYASPYGRATAFLIDRNFSCREISELTLPGRQAGTIHEDTLLDGELIYEKSDTDKKCHFLFMIFDALLINGKEVMTGSLPDRLKCVQNDVIAPLHSDKELARNYPFRLEMKKMWKPYAIAEILELEIPKLRHGNDGLIFTPVADPYVSGTCEHLLKWKPSELNSVDFKLVIHQDVEDEKRKYELQVSTRDGHRFFCYHAPDDRLDEFNEQIIECRYTKDEQWDFIRPRQDKSSANYERVVLKIIDSIKDNVTSTELIQRIPAIRRAWKVREQAAIIDRNHQQTFTDNKAKRARA